MLRELLLFVVVAVLIMAPQFMGGSGADKPGVVDLAPAGNVLSCAGDLVGGTHSKIKAIHGTLDGSKFSGVIVFQGFGGSHDDRFAATGRLYVEDDGISAWFKYRDDEAANYKDKKIIVAGDRLTSLDGVQKSYPEPFSLDWLLLEGRYQTHRALLSCQRG